MKEIETELALTQLKDLVQERIVVYALLRKAKSTASSFPTVSFGYESASREDRLFKSISYEDFEKYMDSLARSFLILTIDPASQGGYRKDKPYQIKNAELERLIEGNEYNIRRVLNTLKIDHTMTRQDLLATIPTKGKKYRHLRPIAEILIKHNEVDMFLLAECLKGEFGINPRSKRPYYTLTRKRYEPRMQRKNLNDLLENRFKTLERKWKRYGYSIDILKNTNTAQLVCSSEMTLKKYMKKFNLLPYLQSFL